MNHYQTFKDLEKAKIAHPPKWLINNLQFLAITGSYAYGASTDQSDIDLVGFCIPPKGLVFPHQVLGTIDGFGAKPEKFEQYQQHHMNSDLREYDVSVYSIVRFFNLCMDNNPNMVDVLFSPTDCIQHITKTAQLVRENRKLFLNRRSYKKFKGYAYSQMAKIRNKNNSSNPKRASSIEKYGYDVKFAYHVIRLAKECEQILTTGDLDLRKDAELYKKIRAGEYTLSQIENFFSYSEKQLESDFNDTELGEPKEEEIKALLLRCLEEHYGSLEFAQKETNSVEKIVAELTLVLDQYR